MSIQIVTGFLVNSSTPIDSKIVASGSTDRSGIPYKYEGMRVFDSSDGFSYVWTNDAFQDERTRQVIGTTHSVPKFTSAYYLGDSNIVSDSVGRIGIGVTTPEGSGTLLQIGDNLSANLPFIVHRRSVSGNNITVVGHNWKYSGSADDYFKAGFGSTTLTFGSFGDLSVKTRLSGSSATSYKQAIYVASTGNVGIGNSISDFSNISPPSTSLEVRGNTLVTGTVSSSYILVSNSGSSFTRGVMLFDPEPLTGASQQGLFVDWGTQKNGYFAGIIGMAAVDPPVFPAILPTAVGGELRFYTTSTNVGTPGSTSDRSLRMTIKNDGKVGIGNYPNGVELLQVFGTASIQKVKLEVGSAASPSLHFTMGMTDTGIYSASTDELDISTAGVNRVAVKSDGKVGIGTTTPSEVLEVSGNTRTTKVISNDGTVSLPSYTFTNSTTTGMYLYSPSANPTSKELRLSLIGADRIVMDSSSISLKQPLSTSNWSLYAAVHRNGGGVDNYLKPSISSGEYTPVFTNGAGVSVSANAIRPANWMRVGNVVSVSGQVVINKTNSSTALFSFSLPVTANFNGLTINNTWRLAGTGCIIKGTQSIPVIIRGNNFNEANLEFYTNSTATNLWMSYIFQYNMDEADIGGPAGQPLDTLFSVL